MGSNCCKGDAANKPNTKRSRGSEELVADERYHLSENNNLVQLAVQRARTDDSGLYSLLAKNAAGEARATLELQVEAAGSGKRRREDGDEPPPTFVRSLNDLAVKVGTRTRLLVELRGAAKVTWLHDEVEAGDGGGRFSAQHEGSFFCLDVSPVVAEDGGMWTCRAATEGGREAECSCYLNVLVPKAYKSPEFLEELRALLTEQGTVSLECKVVGVPTPVLRWFKDGHEIRAGDVFALTASMDDPTSLGTYTCEAANCMGKTYSSSRVHVLGASKSSSASSESLYPTGPPPVFTEELRNEKAKLGDPITLTCRVRVPPWPKEVAWYNSQGRVDGGTSGGVSEKYAPQEDGLGRFSLQVAGLELVDQGEWKCVVTSQEGAKAMSCASVEVTVPKNYRKPRFLDPLKAILTEEGLVSFECKVVGFPTPQLRWFKDGQELRPGDVYQLSGTNSLGSYSCIAQNCMGEASSGAELTIEDIQSQLSEEERKQLLAANQPPRFVRGLKSAEARILEPFKLTIQVTVSPEPRVAWYRDDELIEGGGRYNSARDNAATYSLAVERLEIVDQAEWKCIATNDFGHSVTSCFLKLVIPRHFKKPRFLENLRAILSEEGAVNLECKVIGVPQPKLKWYKDGVELKPGDIHRIISGQDGSCCLGTYTCEASNCMGSVSSSASLLGFEERMAKSTADASRKAAQQQLQQLATMGTSSSLTTGREHHIARDPSLSTIHEERTSQMADRSIGNDRSLANTLADEERAEVSFSFDGREVSVSLYETPDLTEEEALQIVEMYAEELSEHVSEHNVVELPSLRFVKETSTSGKLVMEAVVIDVTDENFESALAANAAMDDERTEADFDNLSITDEVPEGILPQDKLTSDFLDRAFTSPNRSIESDEPPKPPPRVHKKPATPTPSPVVADQVKSSDDSFYSLPQKQKQQEDDVSEASSALQNSESLAETFASAKADISETRKKKQKDEPAYQVAAIEITKPGDSSFKEDSTSENRGTKKQRSRSSSIERRKKSRVKRSSSPHSLSSKSDKISPSPSLEGKGLITLFGRAPNDIEKLQLSILASAAEQSQNILTQIQTNSLLNEPEISKAVEEASRGLLLIKKQSLCEISGETQTEDSLLDTLEQAREAFYKSLVILEQSSENDMSQALALSARQFESGIASIEHQITLQTTTGSTISKTESADTLQICSERFRSGLDILADKQYQLTVAKKPVGNLQSAIYELQNNLAKITQNLTLKAGTTSLNETKTIENIEEILKILHVYQEGLNCIYSKDTKNLVMKSSSHIKEGAQVFKVLHEEHNICDPGAFNIISSTGDMLLKILENQKIHQELNEEVIIKKSTEINQQAISLCIPTLKLQKVPDIKIKLDTNSQKEKAKAVIESSKELQKGLAMIELQAALDFSAQKGDLTRLANSAQQLQKEIHEVEKQIRNEDPPIPQTLSMLSKTAETFQNDLKSTSDAPGILAKTFQTLVSTTKEFCTDVAQAVQDIIIEPAVHSIQEESSIAFETLQRGLTEVAEQLTLEPTGVLHIPKPRPLQKQLSDEKPLQALAQSTRQLHRAVLEKQSSLESEHGYDVSNITKTLAQCNKTFEHALDLIDKQESEEATDIQSQISISSAVAQCSSELHKAIQLIEQQALIESKTLPPQEHSTDLQILAKSAKELQFALMQVEEQMPDTILYSEYTGKDENIMATEVTTTNRDVDIDRSFSQQEELSLLETLAHSAQVLQKDLEQISNRIQNVSGVHEITEHECEIKILDICKTAKEFHHGLEVIQQHALEETVDMSTKTGVSKLVTLAESKLAFEKGLAIIEQQNILECHSGIHEGEPLSKLQTLTLITKEFQRGLSCIEQQVLDAVWSDTSLQDSFKYDADVAKMVDTQRHEKAIETFEQQSLDADLKTISCSIDITRLETVADTVQELCKALAAVQETMILESKGPKLESVMEGLAKSKLAFEEGLNSMEKPKGNDEYTEAEISINNVVLQKAVHNIQRGVAMIEEFNIWERDSGSLEELSVPELLQVAELTQDLKKSLLLINEQLVYEGNDKSLSEKTEISDLKTLATLVGPEVKETLVEDLPFVLESLVSLSERTEICDLERIAKISHQLHECAPSLQFAEALESGKNLEINEPLLSQREVLATESHEELKQTSASQQHECVDDLHLNLQGFKTEEMKMDFAMHSQEPTKHVVISSIQTALDPEESSLSTQSAISGLETLAHSVEEFHRGVALVQEQNTLDDDLKTLSDMSTISKLEALAKSAHQFHSSLISVEMQTAFEMCSDFVTIPEASAIAESKKAFEHGLALIEQQLALESSVDSSLEVFELSRLETLAKSAREFQRGLLIIEQQSVFDAGGDSLSDKEDPSKLATLAISAQEMQKGLAVIEQNVVFEDNDYAEGFTNDTKSPAIAGAQLVSPHLNLAQVGENIRFVEGLSKQSSLSDIASIAEDLSLSHAFDDTKTLLPENDDGIKETNITMGSENKPINIWTDDEDVASILESQLSEKSDVFTLLHQELELEQSKLFSGEETHIDLSKQNENGSSRYGGGYIEEIQDQNLIQSGNVVKNVDSRIFTGDATSDVVAKLNTESEAMKLVEHKTEAKTNILAELKEEAEAKELSELKNETLAKEIAEQRVEEQAKKLGKPKAKAEIKELGEEKAQVVAEKLAQDKEDGNNQAEVKAKEEAKNLVAETAQAEAKKLADQKTKDEENAKKLAWEKSKEDTMKLVNEKAAAEAKKLAKERAKEEAIKQFEENTVAEAKRLAEINVKEEEAKKLAEEKAKEEAVRLAEETANAEANRLADVKAKEEEAMKLAEENAKEEAKKLAKEKAAAEAKRIAEIKAKEEEAKKLAEEKAKAEATKLAEEKAKAEAKKLADLKANEENAKKLAEEKAKEEAKKLAEEKAEEEAKKLAEERAKAESKKLAEIKVKDEEAKKLAEEKAKEEAVRLAEEKAKVEAKRLADVKAKEEEAMKLAEENAKKEAKKLAKEKAAAEAKKFAEIKAKEEEAKILAEEKAKEEAVRLAEEKAKAEANRLADVKAKEEETKKLAEKKAKEEASKLAKEKAAAEAKRLAKIKTKEEEAKKLAEEQAKAEVTKLAEEKAKAEAKKLADLKANEENAKKLAEEKAKEEAKKLAEEKAEEEAKKLAEERAKAESKKLAEIKVKEEEAKKLAEEKAKEEAVRLAEEKAKAEAKRLADVKAKEEEAMKLAEENAKEEAKKLAKEKAAAEAKRLAEIKAKEEEAKKLAEEKAKAEATKLAEEKAKAEAKKLADLKANEEKAKKLAEEKAKEDAKKLAEEKAKEDAKKLAEEKAKIEAKKLADLKAKEEEAMRLAEEKAKDEAKKLAEEKAMAEAKKHADLKAKEEEAKKLAEEKEKEEAKKLAEEKAASEAKKLAEIAAKEEEDAKKLAEEKAKEEAMKLAEEKAKAEAKKLADIKAKEEDAKRLSEVKAMEEAQKLAEEKAKTEAKKIADLQAKEEETKKLAEETAKEEANKLVEEKAAADAKRLAEIKAKEEEAKKLAKEQAKVEATKLAEEKAKAKILADLKANEEKAKKLTEEKAKEEAKKLAEAKAKENAKKLAEEKAKTEAKKLADLKAKEEEAKRLAEEKAKDEAKKLAEEKAMAEAKKHADLKAKEEEAKKLAEEMAKEEANKLAKDKAAAEAKRLAEIKAKEEKAKKLAEEQAKMEATNIAEEKAKAEAKKLADLKAKEEEAKKLAEEKAKEEAKKLAEEKAKEETKKLAEERAKTEAKKLADLKAKEEEAKKLAEVKAMEEAQKLAEEKAKAEAKKIADLQAKEEETKKLAEEKAKEEANKLAKEKAAAEAKRLAEIKAKEEEAKKLAEEQAKAEATKLAEEKAKAEAKKLADLKAKEEEAMKLAKEKAKEEAKKIAEEKAKEEAKKLAEDRAKADLKAKEDETKRIAEEKAKDEAKKLAEEKLKAEAKKHAEIKAKEDETKKLPEGKASVAAKKKVVEKGPKVSSVQDTKPEIVGKLADEASQSKVQIEKNGSHVEISSDKKNTETSDIKTKTEITRHTEGKVSVQEIHDINISKSKDELKEKLGEQRRIRRRETSISEEVATEQPRVRSRVSSERRRSREISAADISTGDENSTSVASNSITRTRQRSRDDNGISDAPEIPADSGRRRRPQAKDHRSKKPHFCSRLTDRTAEQGSRIKLTCSVIGNPEPSIQWHHNENLVPLRSSGHYIITCNDGLASLEIRESLITDSGEYCCTAKNEYGEASSTAFLKIYEGYEPEPSVPTFTRSVKDVYHSSTDELVLECRLRSQQKPTVTWLKDGSKIAACSRIVQEVIHDPLGGGALSCRLVISSPLTSDSGHYVCKAETQTWSDHISADVIFKGRERSIRHKPPSLCLSDDGSIHIPEGKPFITSGLTDYEVPLGGTIALQVEVKGSPKPDVIWMHETAAVPPSPKIRTFEERGVYTLTLVNATASEAGLYTCRAYNVFGRADTSAAIRVVARGGRNDKPAMFVERPDTTLGVAVGEDVVVSFRVTGEPKPQVTWMKGTRDITTSQRVLKETVNDYVRLTLKRALASDAGTYCILARNVYGVDRSFVTVRIRQRARSLTPTPDVSPTDTSILLRDIRDQKEERAFRDVPGPVSSEPTVTESGRSWLTLTWQKPHPKDSGGAPVVAYRVDAWLVGGGAKWEELGVTPINSFDAFNLKAGSEYKFRVTPRNRYGWGESVTNNSTFTVGRRVDLPEFVRILPGQQKVLHGSDIKLECEVKADPSPDVVWYRDGSPLAMSKRVITMFDGSRCFLTLKGVEDADTGRYMCEASNKAGRVSTFARLLVVSDRKILEADNKLKRNLQDDAPVTEAAPHFSMRLRDRRVQITYPVRLTCQVTGHPAPKVTWHKDGEEIKLGDRFTASSSELFHTLELGSALEADSGVYSATARNELGGVSCRCRLVVDKGIRAYIAPVFIFALEPVEARVGGELRLMAQVEAYPTVGITWHRDGIRLRPSRKTEMTLDHEGNVELVVSGAGARDAGVYTCTAINEVGRADCSARVEITAPPAKSSVPQVAVTELYSKEPRFVTKPRSSEAVEGDTVIILCEVIGDPKPEVMWLRDWLRPDYYRDAPHFRRVGDGPEYRLEIPCAKLDYTGAYSVIARNCHGEAKAVISLQISAKSMMEEPSRDQHRPVTHSKVQTLPNISRPLKDRRCCDGDAVTFECGVSAIPDPDVRWEKDGRLLPLGGDMITDCDGSTARLTILQVYPEDEGEYACVAYNELGRASTAACLIVDVPEEKEALLSGQLSRPPGLLSAGSTPRSTPRTTPSRSKSPSITRRARSTTEPTDPLAPAVMRRPRLKVAPPKFYAIPHNKIVEEGATVRFQCAIAGHPTPWVTWDKDGLLVTPTRRLTIKEKDDLRIVEISEVTLEDAGLYRVTLENDVGRIEASARLDVIGPVGSRRSVRAWSASPRTSPGFNRRLAHTTGRYGARVTLACDLKGSPCPSPAWYKDGEQMMASDRVSATFDGQTASLTLDALRPSDAGEYTCEARNEAGSDRCSARLDVTHVPDHVPAPTFEQGLVDTRASDGQAIELQVRLQGSLPPELEVYWLRQGRRLPDCEDFRYLTLGGGRFALHITDVFPQDAGMFTCEARGLFGTVTSSARLTVAEEASDATSVPSDARSAGCERSPVPAGPRPAPTSPAPQTLQDTPLKDKVVNGSTPCELVNGRGKGPQPEPEEESPARVLQGPTDATALRGDCVSLRAKYSGYPEPTVRWLRAGREVRATPGRVAITTTNGESTLTLSCITADDSGKYVVAATNALGSHCHFASLAVEGPPDPPSGRPSVVVSGATSAVVAWGSSPYDGGRKVASYRVEQRGVSGEWHTVADGCNSLSHTLRDLTPGQEYVVRVSASNIHGLSDPGQESATFVPGETAARLAGCSNGEDEEEVEEAWSSAAAVTVERTENAFASRYHVHEELGKGRFGIVYRVTQAATGQRRAAKFVRCIKAKDREKVYEEIEIMNCLRHPKLLQLEAAFESTREIIMVMEYITGGELFERVVADDFTLTERDCILFMRQICEGVQYMHSQDIVHLDLKPENIMCRTRTSHHIKLIDFGLAKRLDGDEPVRVLFGTPEFVPPEVINYEPISVASDMWSVGVICYVLLSGLSPFMGDSDAETFANTTRADFDFDDEAFDAISQDAKDFISALLVQRKEKRMTAGDCLQHPWLAQQDRTMQYVKLSTDKLKKFIIRRKWQKTGNAIRALGRMANLSARRNSSSAAAASAAAANRPGSCSRLSSLNEDHALELNGSGTEHAMSLQPLHMRKVRMFSDRSDSGFSETSSTSSRPPSREPSFDSNICLNRSSLGNITALNSKSSRLRDHSSVDSGVELSQLQDDGSGGEPAHRNNNNILKTILKR